MANEIVGNAGIATVNGEKLLGDKLFIDGVFDTVGLDGNKNLQSTEDEPVAAGIVCPRLGTTGSGTVTIDNVRYAGPLYPNITTASTDSFVVAVQGGSFRNAHQDILRDRIGVIDDSWFHNTTAGNRHGAALSLFDGSKTTITGSTFTNNSNTSGNGGAIGGSTASSIDSGGGSELTLQNCFFANNISTGQCGGAIYGSTNSQLTISGSTFTCNTANNYGGVIYATTRVELKISDSVFSGNIVTKGNGGAIHLEREVSATITGSTFSGNTAGVKTAGLGGAITVCFNSSLVVSGCTFAGNIAYNYAGAIFVNSEGQSTTIENCVFATKSDSIVIDTGTVSFSGTITLATDVRKENHPERGHYLCSTDKVDFVFINEESISIAKLDNAENIRSLSFRSTEMVNFTDLELSDTSISIDCELPSLGQSLSIASGLTSLGSGTITVHGKNAVGGKALVGDGLYKVYLSDNFLTITSEEYVRAAIVTSNGAEWVQVGSTNYAGNFYPSIDAALKQEDFVVMQGTFATRSSVTGANKRAVISQIDVTGNAVDVDGGALMISEGFASITASAFSRNVARNGGAIANDEGRLIILGSTFTDNTAIQNGGAIHGTGGGMGSVENALFTGNVAREAGGAVYCADAASALSISGSTFTDNAAIQNGGAIYLKDGTVNITDCVFSATSDTIYNDDGVLTLGGTVWTAANITSTNAISVEENTSL
ncbi:MAG: right-handed parallel beta-helix repeat-containing protein, partial [Victivallaceae bacterium]|nr:right-handed parallel beta-helix repeat-containing protein [Victivallaceae bacterium]